MRKILKLGIVCAAAYFLIACAGLMADKAQLKNELIRMHIVANSDSEKDQAVKLQVKDAIVSYLQPIMVKFTDKEEASQYIRDHLQKIEEIANGVLKELGENKTAAVTLTQEAFDIRKYETFSLPSGIYDALRVEIGAAEGKNWWCVAFPSLCTPAAGEEFADTAAASGFSDTLTKTVAEEDGYEIRFFFLDMLGRLEIFFH